MVECNPSWRCSLGSLVKLLDVAIELLMNFSQSEGDFYFPVYNLHKSSILLTIIPATAFLKTLKGHD